MPDFTSFAQALRAQKVGGRFVFSCPLPSHGKGNGDRNPSVELIDHDPEPPGVCCYGGCDNSAVWAASIKPMLDRETPLPPPKPALKENNLELIPFLATHEEPTESFLLSFAQRNQWELEERVPLERYGYRWGDGRLACCVVRFNLADGGKEVRACRFNGMNWTWRTAGYGPAPLYNLPALLFRAEDQVLIVEGEKTAKAAMALERLQQYVAVCPWGGSSVRPTDWTPLQGRQVIIVPDNDLAGKKFSERVSRHAQEAKAEKVKVYNPQDVYAKLGQPGKCPVGWDIADIKDAAPPPVFSPNCVECGSTKRPPNHSPEIPFRCLDCIDAALTQLMGAPTTGQPGH